MSQSSKAAGRLLDKAEQDLVGQTRRPAIGAASDSELRDLAARLRERRDRARDTSNRQKREMRGKSEPRGAQPAADNTGTKAKTAALSAALKRVTTERSRRAEKERAPSQRSLARKALRMKQRQALLERPASRRADEGMHSIENGKTAVSGALDHAGQRPAMQRAKFARR